LTISSSESPTIAAKLGLWLGPLAAMGFWISPLVGYSLSDHDPALNAMAGAFVWMAIWWLTEAIPLAATSLLPLVLFPLLEIQSVKDVAANFGNASIFLFLGGFLVAIAIENSGLHRRIALWIVYVMGDNPARLLLGFMLATGLMSMWISNTATALLMLPIAISILAQADLRINDETARKNLSVGLMLGIAYAASIGGVATKIGTPPNIAFFDYYQTTFPDAPMISFLSWMLVVFPFSFMLMAVAWGALAYLLFPVQGTTSLGGRDSIADELAKLGPVHPAELRAGTVFAVTALLWIFREPVEGWGWGMAFVDDAGKALVGDATPAMAMAILCFVIPQGGERTEPLLNWEASKRIPWGVLLLFGGCRLGRCR